MAIHVYHPSKSMKGFACSFWYSNRDNCVFATLVKQSGWDNENSIGVFKASFEDPTKHVNIKLSEVEIGSILECLDHNREFKSYHEHEQTPKSINFVPWMGVAQKDIDGNVIKAASQQGFSFSISVGNKQDTTQKNSFYIGLNFGEARLIREFLIHALQTFFNSKNATI